MATLTVRDESVSGEVFEAFALHFPSASITVRQLIRERVHQEVLLHTQSADSHQRQCLVVASALEATLNSARQMTEQRPVDWRKQADIACQAFERNGFVILLDEQQAEHLDDILTIRHDSVASFIKLTPLVGG
ncbi:hypothetical protein [Pseudomonas sp. BBP2017]|uniref:hypothetical protein n=1 Tax=Pseudomonas sp. BBP2017 TaxID=2109731 RepID=UPI000D1355DA|nr:hypothetical protein [Pseudomonas sp. BBP2017]PSS47025.1 hypothetical protein C6382_22305 [Pseudomonas sp. BBP2017]